MRSPRLGDPVYWVSQERPPGKSARVTVRHGKYLARDGGRLAVVVCDTLTAFLSERDVYFADPADADTFAFGTACRLLANFRYEEVEVVAHAGTTVLRASELFAPLRSAT